METVILVIHIILALTLVGVILLQRSEGGGLGMGGGSGTGGGLISTRGAADLLTRMTAILAGCFMLTSIALAILAKNRNDALAILEAPVAVQSEEQAPTEPEFPAVPLSE